MITYIFWLLKRIHRISFLKPGTICKKAYLFFIISNFALLSFSQKIDSTAAASHFSGMVTITNKGIATIPTFTLGKPAVIFDMNLGKRKLSFEPQFKFGLNGKPWAFLFWWRYKLINSDKFHMNMGAHPSIAFKTISDTAGGADKEYMKADRYLAGELSPTWLVTKNIGVGIYYMYARGLTKDVTKNTHYLTFRLNFSHIKLFHDFYLRFNPQIYYLRMDDVEGYYMTGIITLAKSNFPLSVSSLINKTIQTEIPGSQDLIWNINLVYSFSNQYTRL